MEDEYTRLEKGIKQILLLFNNHIEDRSYSDILTLQERLTMNIKRSRSQGFSKERETERIEIINQLNRLSIGKFNVSFTEICDKACKRKEGVTENKIPLIVFAMTRSEAENLLQDYNKSKELKSLIENISKGKDVSCFIEELIGRYNTKRNQWKPFQRDSRGLNEIIDDLFQKSNTVANSAQLRGKRDLIPMYFEENLFSTNREARRKISEYFIQENCIVIIDILSLFHRELSDNFVKSLVIANNPIIAISPLSEDSLNTCDIVQRSMGDKLDIVFDRYLQNFDVKCSLEVFSPSTFNRWVNMIIPDIIFKVPKVYSENINQLSENLNFQPKGIQDLVMSMGATK